MSTRSTRHHKGHTDHARERATDVHTGAPGGQPLPRRVPGDVNVDLSAGLGWPHRDHRADGATSRAVAELDGAGQRFPGIA